MDKRFSTTEIPAKFLKPTFHVGHIPLRTLASDPRVLYTLYIPPEHYRASSDQPLENGGLPTPYKLPLLVHVHGTTRNLTEFYTTIKNFADITPCAVLAPIFPAGLEGPNDLHSYKQLHATDLRFDLALISMLDEVAQVWPGINTTKIFLQGFSGGGQFAHRFFYLHPERLDALSIGAPGSVTLLDATRTWPRGIGDVQALFGKNVDRDLLRQVRIQLVIGGDDNKIYGSDFWDWLRKVLGKSKPSLTQKVENDGHGSALPLIRDQDRMEAMHQLRDGWTAGGIESQLDIVDGVSHNFGGVVDHILKFMGPLMQST